MLDTSFFVVSIRDHAFFEQAVLQCQIGDAFLKGMRFAAQVQHPPLVAARAVLTESLRLPASMNSLDQV
jgi:hypothetical protein